MVVAEEHLALAGAGVQPGLPGCGGGGPPFRECEFQGRQALWRSGRHHVVCRLREVDVSIGMYRVAAIAGLQFDPIRNLQHEWQTNLLSTFSSRSVNELSMRNTSINSWEKERAMVLRN